MGNLQLRGRGLSRCCWRQLYAVAARLQAALPQYGATGREFQRFSIGKNGPAFARIGEITKSLLIVAHAPSDNTRALLDAVRSGAEEAGAGSVSVTVLSPWGAGPGAVRASDAVILGTTENLGYMSGALKDFFDRSYYKKHHNRNNSDIIHCLHPSSSP